MKTILKWIAKNWHPKNATRDLLSTFIGLLGMILMFYYFNEAGITFAELLEGLGFFAFFCGINLTNRGGGSAAVCVLFVLSLSVLGCVSKSPSKTSKTEIKDSTIIAVKTVYDTLKVGSDSVQMVLTNPCPELGIGKYKPKIFKHKSKNKRAAITVTRDSTGKQTIDCECLAYKEVIARQDSTISHFRQKDSYEQETFVEYKTHWYDWLARALALAFIIITFNTIISKIK